MITPTAGIAAWGKGPIDELRLMEPDEVRKRRDVLRVMTKNPEQQFGHLTLKNNEE